MHYVMVLLSVVGLAAQFSLTKVWQQRMGTGMRMGMVYNMLLGLFGAVIMFAIGGFRWEFTLYSFLMAALTSLATGAYTLAGIPLISRRGVSIYTLFLMLGGMVPPYLYGLLFLNETFSVWRTIGLLLIAAALVLVSGGTNGRMEKTDIVLCLLVFLLNGVVSIVSKVHQVETVHAVVSAGSFVLLGNLAKVLVTGAAVPFIRRDGEPAGERTARRSAILPMLVLAAVTAAISALAYMLQLMGASALPATVLYPLVTGGTIVLTALAGRVFFREKLTPRLLTAIGLCCAATLLFL